MSLIMTVLFLQSFNFLGKTFSLCFICSLKKFYIHAMYFDNLFITICLQLPIESSNIFPLICVF